MSDIQDEIQEVLSHPENVQFEELEGEESSPLNEPVVNNDGAGIQSEPAQEQSNSQEQQADTGTPASQKPQQEPQPEEEADEPLDAGEQEIDDNYAEATVIDDEEEFEIPTGHAKQAADTILGMTDNVLAIGGGYFVKLRKHKEYYEFEEIIHVIDNQNEKNVKRIKLDEEDKVLLRPLLITILKKKAKKLTPEQQLMGAIISIMMKKAQMVMEIKAENDILTERILDIIREEKGYSEQDEDYQEQADENEDKQEKEPEEEYQEEEPEDETVEEVEERVVVKREPAQTITPAQVMEVAEDEPEEKPASEKQQASNQAKSDKK